jgi:predicted RNA-binding Zn ribbon-like protein
MDAPTNAPTGDERAPGHGDAVASPAPGELEHVRGFLSLHDHTHSGEQSLPPSAATLESWLRRSDLIDRDEPVEPADLAWALDVRTALSAKVRENAGSPRDHDAVEILNRAAQETGLKLCFGCVDNRLHTEALGVRGAIGRLLGVTFLADLEGTFHRLRECSSPTCTVVFYDRTKNHTTRWCSMATCGNRDKVRRFRERERATANAETPDATRR